MEFKGIEELAEYLYAYHFDGMSHGAVRDALLVAGDEGALMKFLEANRDLLKQERPITMNAKLVTLFDRLVGAVKSVDGDPINVARFFEDEGVDLYSKVGDLGMYGLFTQVGKGVWALTNLGRDFYEVPTTLLPKTIWVRNCEVVRVSPEKINFMVALNAATS